MDPYFNSRTIDNSQDYGSNPSVYQQTSKDVVFIQNVGLLKHKK